MCLYYTAAQARQGRRLLLSLAFTFFSIWAISADPNSYRSTFTEVSDLQPSSVKKAASSSSIFNSVFHRCSITLRCIYVVEDTKTGKYTTYSYKNQIPTNQDYMRIWEKHFERKGIKLSVTISSIGKDDTDFDSIVSGIEVGKAIYVFDKKGLHAVVISAEDGQFVKRGSFDMVDDVEASSKFITFINDSPKAAIILLCTYDDASVRLTNDAKAIISGLGAESSIGFRGSFVLASQKDMLKPTWFREGYTAAGNGPAHTTVQINF